MSNHADLLIKKLIFSCLIMIIFLLLGDFNLEMRYSCTKNFCLLYTLKRLIRTPTCFKIPDNLKFIDLVLTSRPKTFYDSDTFETGQSDFHKLTLAVLRMFLKNVHQVYKLSKLWECLIIHFAIIWSRSYALIVLERAWT